MTTEPVAPTADPVEPTEPTTPEPEAVEPTEPEQVTVPKADLDALRRKVAEGEKAKRDAEKAKADAERKRLEEEGKHREIAEQEKARADLAEQALQRAEQTARITAAAARLKFRKATDAAALLPADVDLSTDAAVEAALSALATESPYLIDTGTVTRTGTPAGGDQDHAGLTRESLKSMTAEQIAALSDKELHEAMSRG